MVQPPLPIQPTTSTMVQPPLPIQPAASTMGQPPLAVPPETPTMGLPSLPTMMPPAPVPTQLPIQSATLAMTQSLQSLPQPPKVKTLSASDPVASILSQVAKPGVTPERKEVLFRYAESLVKEKLST